MVRPGRTPAPAVGAAVHDGHADTPLGPVLLCGTGGGLSGLYFTGHRHSPQPGAAWEPAEAPFAPVRRQLEEYFDGRRTGFDLPLDMRASPFELVVWTALQTIPY